MKKYMLSLLVCFMLIPSVITPVEAKQAPRQTNFNDISDSYAKDSILRLAKRNIVSGNGTGAFLPRAKVTRAEFVAMVDRLLQMDPVQNDIPAFQDVSKQAWHYGWIHAGVNLGIISGKGERTFKPNDPVTRQEAAVIVVRAMKQAILQEEDATYTGYRDDNELSSWSRNEVAIATLKGWMQGSEGRFRPKDDITRQEAAKLLDRILLDGNVLTVLDNNAKEETGDIRMGWMYNGSTKQFIKDVKTAGLNTLVPRWYFIESSGLVSDHTDRELIKWAHMNDRKVWGMLGNRADAETTHRVLGDVTSRHGVIQVLAEYVEKYKLDGINVDFENVLPEDRYYLTSFIRELSSALKQRGAVLSINVSPDLNTDWTEAFDYAALGQYADYVVLMGYDEHWGGSPKAGSVSSIPWLTSAVNKLLAQVPAEKSIIALPLYTREWRSYPSVTSEDISLTEQGERIQKHLATLVWQDTVGQYEASYLQAGYKRRIWAEDARSLSAKHSMVADHHTAGFAYWYPGSETPDVWQAIKNIKRYKSYDFDI